MEWEYRIARMLHRTIAELRASITEEEFLGWQVYLSRHDQMRQLHG